MATATRIEVESVWYPGFLPEDSAELESGHPPIIVVGAEDGSHELVDGYHRLAAAKVSGRAKIRAIVVTAEEYAQLETVGEDKWIEAMQDAA